MVGIIRRGYAGIENIIAVTFTRKAAAELRERFQIRLEELLKSHDTTDAEKKYINQALLRFESASISTMHTFCAKILKERPVEAGIDPGFEEIEETEDFMFAEQVWYQYIENQGTRRESGDRLASESWYRLQVTQRYIHEIGVLSGRPDIYSICASA